MNKIIIFLIALILISNVNSKKIEYAKTAKFNNIGHIHSEIENDLSANAQFLERDHKSSFIPSQSQGTNSIFIDQIIGGFLFAFSIGWLWLNEKRFVKNQKRLELAIDICKELNPAQKDSSLDGELVHASGITTNSQLITDPVFQVVAENSVWLKRQCEVEQWVEIQEQRNEGSGEHQRSHTIYRYEMKWCDVHVDSAGFREGGGHQNYREDFLIQSLKQYGTDVKLGVYSLNKSQQDLCVKGQKCDLAQNILQSVQNAQQINKRNHPNVTCDGSYVYFNKAQQQQGQYQQGQQQQGSSGSGNFRISFQKVPCGPTSVLCQVQGSGFKTWDIQQAVPELTQYSDDGAGDSAENGPDRVNLDGNTGCCAMCTCMCSCLKAINKPFKDLNELQEKLISKNAMFQNDADENAQRTSIQRYSGVFIMWLSVYMFFSPVYTLLGWFPLIGGLLGTLGHWIISLVAALIAVPVSLLIIGISWLRFRPKVAIGLILGGGLVILLIAKSYQPASQLANSTGQTLATPPPASASTTSTA